MTNNFFLKKIDVNRINRKYKNTATKMKRNLSVATQHKLYGLSIILLNVVIFIITRLSPVELISRLVVGIIFIRDSIYVMIQLIHRLVGKGYDGVGKSREKSNVLCVLPTYKEDIKEVKITLNSLLDQVDGDNKMNLRIIMICDGYFSYSNIFSDMTLMHVLPYNTFTKIENKVSIYKATYQECDVAILIKERNSGKKDSLILVDNIFVCNGFKEVKSTLLGNIFKVNKFNHIFHTDADTYITQNTVSVAKKILTTDREIAAVTGFVLVPAKFTFWCLVQGFEYYYEQIICRMTESCWGKLFILPGCINMVNIDSKCLVDASREFQRLPTKENIFQINDRLQGTDRRFTNCLLGTSNSMKLVFSPEMCSYTMPPQGFRHFISQRNRWMSNAISGYIYQITRTSSSWYMRLLALVELFYIHTCVTRLLLLLGVPSHLGNLETYDLVFTLSGIFIPYVFIIGRIVQSGMYGWFLLAGCLVNVFVAPFLNICVFISCFINFTSVSWGKTHGAISNKKSLS